MSLVGVRELRQQTSEVIRRVREEQAEYVVTYQGRPVAIILPLDTARAEAAMVQAGKKAAPGTVEQTERLAREVRDARPPYQIAERPTAELEETIILAAQRLAQEGGVTISEVLSSLAERALSPQANGELRQGVPLFPVRSDASPVTLDVVNQLRDETP